MGRVEGKVALITGGASGLGRADAQVLAREGASVILTDISAEAGEAVAEDICNRGHKARFMVHDVTDPEAWAQVIEVIKNEFGQLDILVNNAGIVFAETPEDCSLETFRKQNAVMSEAVFIGCKSAMPLMAESGGGSIINMSSIASHLGFPVYFAYTAAKGAVRAMSKSLAVHCQMAGYNIRVNTIHPGAIDTPMIEQTQSDLGLESKDDISPVVGIGSPEDVANAVLFLASDESRFINGTELIIDNALSIQ